MATPNQKTRLIAALALVVLACTSSSDPIPTPLHTGQPVPDKPKPTFSPTPTPTLTASPYPTATPTYAPVPTYTPVATWTPTPQPTAVPSPATSPTAIPRPTPTPPVVPHPTAAPTYAPVPTYTPSPAWTPTPQPTAVISPTVTPTAIPSPTATPVPLTDTPTPALTPSPTHTTVPSRDGGSTDGDGPVDYYLFDPGSTLGDLYQTLSPSEQTCIGAEYTTTELAELRKHRVFDKQEAEGRLFALLECLELKTLSGIFYSFLAGNVSADVGKLSPEQSSCLRQLVDGSDILLVAGASINRSPGHRLPSRPCWPWGTGCLPASRTCPVVHRIRPQALRTAP